MTSIFTLNCYVPSQVNAFEVEIGGHESVAALQDVIKGKMGDVFHDVDSDFLVLRKVSVLSSETLSADIEACIQSNQFEWLEGTQYLSSRFQQDPVQGHVHIVVDSPVFKLLCSCKGENDVFEVEVLRDISISRLRDIIKKKRSPQFDLVPATSLVLRKVSIPNSESLRADVETILLAGIKPLKAVDSIEEVFTETHSKNVQVIVWCNEPYKSLEAGFLAKQSKKRQIISLPPLEELAAFIHQPLPDDTKIPIPPHIFDRLVDTPYICSAGDAQCVFKLDPEIELGCEASVHVGTVLNNPSGPDTWHTTKSFISFWDGNISCVIEEIVPEGRVIRDSNCHTGTARSRRGYGFLLDDICVFCGEEKAQCGSKDPKAALSNKFAAWEYGPAPYVLGYYCVGPKMTLVAITPPANFSGMPGSPYVHDLVTVDLSQRRGRIANLHYLINLSTLLRPLSNMIKSAS